MKRHRVKTYTRNVGGRRIRVRSYWRGRGIKPSVVMKSTPRANLSKDELFDVMKDAVFETMEKRKEVGFVIYERDGRFSTGWRFIGDLGEAEISGPLRKASSMFHTHPIHEGTPFGVATLLSPADIEFAEHFGYKELYLGVADSDTGEWYIMRFEPAPPSDENDFTGWEMEPMMMLMGEGEFMD